MLVSLTIPDDKAHVCDWLLQQSPDTTAHVLELTQTVYKMNQMNTHISHDNAQYLQLIHEWEQKYKHLLVSYQDEIADVISKTKENCNQEYEHKLLQYKKRIDELTDTNVKEREYYTNQIAYTRQTKEKEFEQFTKLVSDSQMENEKLHKSVNDLTKLFTGSASNMGIVGENLVHYTFNTLQLGFLEDMRYDTSPGCEDFLWSNGDMMCSVEVKNSKCLHSKHDIEKHIKRIDEATHTSKINCALFLSLNARVPNMTPFQIQSHSGIPVLYVSKHDSVSHQTLIELAFRFMHIIWNLYSKNTDTSQTPQYNRVFHDISSAFSQQTKSLSALDDSISIIEKNTQQTFTQLQKLRKSKASLLQSLDNFYALYPVLKPIYQSNPNDEFDQIHNSLIKGILTFHAKRKKYPKEIQNVKCYIDDDQEFDELVLQYANEFPAIVQSIKKSKIREKK